MFSLLIYISLHIPENSSLSNIYVENTFPSLWLAFYFGKDFFWWPRIFNFHKVKFANLCYFMVNAFASVPRNLCTPHSPIFSSRSFMALASYSGLWFVNILLIISNWAKKYNLSISLLEKKENKVFNILIKTYKITII